MPAAQCSSSGVSPNASTNLPFLMRSISLSYLVTVASIIRMCGPNFPITRHSVVDARWKCLGSQDTHPTVRPRVRGIQRVPVAAWDQGARRGRARSWPAIGREPQRSDLGLRRFKAIASRTLRLPATIRLRMRQAPCIICQMGQTQGPVWSALGVCAHGSNLRRKH